MTLNEAMSVGTPVLSTTAVAAARDLIHDGDTGYVVAAGDAEALAERLLAAAGDPARTREIGLRGQERIRREFRPENKAATFASVVNIVAARS